MRRTITTPAVAAVVLAASVIGFSSGGGDTPLGVALPTRLAANLESFSGCDDLAAYFDEMPGPGVRAVPGRGEVVVVEDGTAMMFAAPPQAGTVSGTAGGTAGAGAGGGGAAGGPAPSGEAGGPAVAESVPGAATTQSGALRAVADSASGAGPGAFSVTNVQEAGVDEPDIVKTDGQLVVAVAQNTLHVVDVRSGEPRVIGTLALVDGSHELFLTGERAIVLSRSWDTGDIDDTGDMGDTPGVDTPGVEAVPQPEPVDGERARSIAFVPAGDALTVVSVVDLSDPARPHEVASKRFEGDYVTARLVDGVIRMVIRSGAGVHPLPGSGEAGDASDWLPEQIVEGEDGEPVREPLVACDAVARPPEPSGFGTTTVVTFATSGSLDVLDSDAVVADAQTVYASEDTLYVATTAWGVAGDVPVVAPDGGETTSLHAFDISSPETTEYVGSGRVRGRLLDQWSVSEHEGHLRVATTEGPSWDGPGASEPSSESFLTVLARSGDRLETVGQVGGLGPGEQIYAVRYFGDVGFVVTFRQTDPLYSLDLSDPEQPRVVGALKITGFSEYLHPVGEGRLLGLGQDADEQGRTQGLQVALFDVSDLTEVRRVDQAVLPGGSSMAEHDHRAFLWWAPAGLAVVPASVYEPMPVDDRGVPLDAAQRPFVGAIGFSVSSSDVAEAGRVTHPAPSPEPTQELLDTEGADFVLPEYWGDPEIRRAIVAGDTLYTLSEQGLLASDLASFAPQGFARF